MQDQNAAAHGDDHRFILVTEDSLYDDYYDDVTQDRISVLGPLSRVNIFVGANNSGKSRLLRKIFQSDTYDTLPMRYYSELRALSGVLEGVLEQCADAKKLYLDRRGAGEVCEVDWLRAVYQQSLTMSPKFWRNVGPRTISPEAGGVLNFLKLACLSDANVRLDGRPIRPVAVDKSAAALIENIPGLTKDAQVAPVKCVYIPIHRSAVSLFHDKDSRETRDVFCTTVVHNYKLKKNSNKDIFTGLDLYGRVMSARNGRRPERERFEKFEKFLGETFFSGQSIELVAHASSTPAEQHVNVVIGAGGAERELHNLGDGISALAVLLYPIFMAESNAWIVIEEPEINLHPGFQRLFLETILDHPAIRSKNLRIFFTTHSNHLLGLVKGRERDASVFNLSPRPLSTDCVETFSVRLVQGASMSVLDQLGVENGSVFLANCTVWVEGPSDRILVRAYLESYAKCKGVKYIEDIDYAFVLYGGSLIEHYLFVGEEEDGQAGDGLLSGDRLKRIRAQCTSNRVFLLCDLDENPKKHKRHTILRGFVNEHFGFRTTHPAIEIENTISNEILKDVLPRLHPQKFRGKDLAWLDNAVDCSDTRLGQLCAMNEIFFAKEGSGSLLASDKTELAKLVYQHQPAWSSLGPTAQALTEAIAMFIGKHARARIYPPAS